ncbi:MAG: PaaI family thioesterase [Bryobacteraceae bacterium]|nr:PaaI family thioesterase [Bryobacteraceae bacterium]MDW8377222.1 PaaI family thioesterase [Bryobacterales bacterium]
MTYTPLSLHQLRELVGHMPFNHSLGLRIARVHRDGVTVEIPFRPDLKNLAGGLHGGVSAALADAAVGLAIMRHFGGRRRCATVELKINYFRPVTRGKLVARSKLLRLGSTLVVGSVELRDSEGRMTGMALATYMLLAGDENLLETPLPSREC